MHDISKDSALNFAAMQDFILEVRQFLIAIAASPQPTRHLHSQDSSSLVAAGE
jgi:hypothetical protein